jgi:cobalamin-dependent methionine synthase I
MTLYPGVHTICGLSNISFGSPQRKPLNQTFMIMAVTQSLDAAVVNPLDKRMMANIVSARSRSYGAFLPSQRCHGHNWQQ